MGPPVQPGPARPATAFFGIAFRPEYIQREYESHYGDDHPQGGFTYAIVGQQRFDPAADLILEDELRAFGDKSPQNPEPVAGVRRPHRGQRERPRRLQTSVNSRN